MTRQYCIKGILIFKKKTIFIDNNIMRTLPPEMTDIIIDKVLDEFVYNCLNTKVKSQAKITFLTTEEVLFLTPDTSLLRNLAFVSRCFRYTVFNKLFNKIYEHNLSLENPFLSNLKDLLINIKLYKNNPDSLRLTVMKKAFNYRIDKGGFYHDENHPIGKNFRRPEDWRKGYEFLLEVETGIDFRIYQIIVSLNCNDKVYCYNGVNKKKIKLEKQSVKFIINIGLNYHRGNSVLNDFDFNFYVLSKETVERLGVDNYRKSNNDVLANFRPLDYSLKDDETIYREFNEAFEQPVLKKRSAGSSTLGSSTLGSDQWILKA